MSEDRRRRIRIGTGGRVGEPNILSDAATPNRLTDMAGGPPIVPVEIREGSEGWLSSGATPAKPRVGLPSIGTVIFLGLLAITGFRLLGQVVEGLATETPAATSTVADGPGVRALVPGSVVFGTASDGDCGVVGSSGTFSAGSEVWWSALLSTEQGPTDEVVVIVERDGLVISREAVPPDSALTTWSFLCNSSPLRGARDGTYLVAIWNSDRTVRYALGEFELTPS